MAGRLADWLDCWLTCWMTNRLTVSLADWMCGCWVAYLIAGIWVDWWLPRWMDGLLADDLTGSLVVWKTCWLEHRLNDPLHSLLARSRRDFLVGCAVDRPSRWLAPAPQSGELSNRLAYWVPEWLARWPAGLLAHCLAGLPAAKLSNWVAGYLAADGLRWLAVWLDCWQYLMLTVCLVDLSSRWLFH